VLLLSFAFFIVPSFGPWFGNQHQMDQPSAPGMVYRSSFRFSFANTCENTDNY